MRNLHTLHIFSSPNTTKQNKLEQLRPVKTLRIALSSSISIILASALGLNYSTSAGIISFLSIQDTKLETFKDVIIRCISYILSVLISFVVFNICGYNTIAFGVFMFLLVGISYYFSWDSVLSSSAVVSTHFLMEKSHSPELLLNELLLLFIGVGTAMITNLLISNNTKTIKNDINIIEDEFASTFSEMSHYILHVDDTQYDKEKLEILIIHIEKSHKRAILNKNNDSLNDSNYYLSYMEARKRQAHTLSRIASDMHSLTSIPFNAEDISVFLSQLSETIHLRNNTLELIHAYTELNNQFNHFPMPGNREAFDNLSYVHDILKELSYFLDIKKEFVQTLSAKQITRYWSDGEPLS